jgi:hypothetical protein
VGEETKSQARVGLVARLASEIPGLKSVAIIKEAQGAGAKGRNWGMPNGNWKVAGNPRRQFPIFETKIPEVKT